MNDHKWIKRILGLLYIAGVAVFCVFAYGSYQTYQTSKQNLVKADAALIDQSRKNKDLINTNRNKVVYLSPTGAKATKDVNVPIINKIIHDTFSYNSPQEFYSQAKYIKNRVEGPFYDYWFGDGIKNSYEHLVDNQNGSTLKRVYKDYYLTKKNNGHYFAVISTTTKYGYDDKATPVYRTFGLDITWNRKTGRWHFKQLPNVDAQ